MSEAEDTGAFFDAVRELLELGEFVHARVRLGRNGGEGSGEAIRWTWERGDIEAAEICSSCRFWTMRLPLSTERGEWGYINLYRGLDDDALLLDINYLCRLFQRETALAAERILSKDVARKAKGAVVAALSN